MLPALKHGCDTAIKRRALANEFSVRMFYMYLLLKCRSQHQNIRETRIQVCVWLCTFQIQRCCTLSTSDHNIKKVDSRKKGQILTLRCRYVQQHCIDKMWSRISLLDVRESRKWSHDALTNVSDLLQPIAFGMSCNLNLQSQSCECLFNKSRQQRPRERDQRLRFENEEIISSAIGCTIGQVTQFRRSSCTTNPLHSTHTRFNACT